MQTVQFRTFDEMAAVLSANTPHALVQDWWGRLEGVIRAICARLGAPSQLSVSRLIDEYLPLHEAASPELIPELHQMRRFRNRIDAKIVIESFRRHYNEVRPHSSIAMLTPLEFKQKLLATKTPSAAVF